MQDDDRKYFTYGALYGVCMRIDSMINNFRYPRYPQAPIINPSDVKKLFEELTDIKALLFGLIDHEDVKRIYPLKENTNE